MTSGRKHGAGTRRGFTLIELMVVIVILGALVALVGPNIWNALVGSTRDATKFQIDGFKQAINMYYVETRALPNSLSDLTQPSKKTGEAYIEGGRVPDDPWGSPYDYRITNATKREYVISSNGEDKIAGTPDDIVYNSAEGFK